MQTKFKVAKVGDVIRSLDFPGIMDYYMIGIVTEVNGDLIKVKGISRVTKGVAEACFEKFETVQNGAHFMDKHFQDRITVL